MDKKYAKLNHNVNEENPFRLKHDRWEQTGPGLRDMHYDVELGIVCHGRMRREFGGYKRTLSAGSLWLQGIWEPHAAHVIEAPLELFIIHINPSTLAKMSFCEAPNIPWLIPFTIAAQKRPCGTVLPESRIKDYLAELSSLVPEDRGFDALRLRFIALNLLLDIIQHKKLVSGVQPEQKFSSKLDHVLNHVFKEQGRISAQDIAKKFGFSRNGFNYFFQKHMGISFAKFALHQRLSAAAEELMSGNETIKAISLKWGFCDVSHFYQRFGKIYGCTPVEYRERKSCTVD